MMMLRRPSSAARLSSRLGRTSLTSVSRRLSTAALNSDGPAIDLEEAAASILEDGFVVLPNLLDTDALAAVKDSIGAHTENILTSLADKGAELPVGSVHGFHECVLRSPKRFDMPFRIEAPAAVESIAQRVLLINEHATGATVCAFSGVVRAAPGCPAQLWHADSAHLVAEHAPPHLLNVLVALSDVSMADGPSEVLPGSHFLTNHHRAGCGFDADELVYQKETNTPATIGALSRPEPEATHAPQRTICYAAHPALAVLSLLSRTWWQARWRHRCLCLSRPAMRSSSTTDCESLSIPRLWQTPRLPSAPFSCR